jgi:superoxide dismutase
MRPKFIEAFWNLVNWEFVESQLQGTKKAVEVPVG